jgi:hypothetical protein
MRRQSDSLSGATFIKQCFASVAEDLHGRDSGAGATVLLQAAREHKKINLILVPQIGDEEVRAPSFSVPKRWKRPTVILLGDDFGWADGPRAFDRRSVRTVLESADGIVLVASGSLVETPDGLAPLGYTKAIELAVNGHNRLCVLIETLPEVEEAWLALIEKHRRKNAHVIFCAVKDAPRGPRAALFAEHGQHLTAQGNGQTMSPGR